MSGPAAIVKRTSEEYADWLSTEVGFISGLASYEDEPLELERYQIAFMQNPSPFRSVTKARQVGYSFTIALEALARCHLRDGHTSIFVSYNRDDAKEKILVAREIYETLPLAYQKRLVVDSKTELAFQSNSGGRRKLSRIISAPSRAPRGKHGDIYLDELAHYLTDRDVYKGSTALIMRSHGQLSSVSTPMGKRGIFWEIAEEEVDPYPEYSRQVVPWWLCSFLCTDVSRAAREAPAMPTEERVEKFGTPPLVQQFRSLPLEDFQQEFECIFVMESAAFFPYDLIIPCTDDDLDLAEDFGDLPKPQGRLVAGYDVGRRHDRAELSIFDELESGKKICRLLKTYDKVPFHEQEGDLRRMLNTLPIARFTIDETGLGMHLAENLSLEFPQVDPVSFSNQQKERWANDLKIQMQKRLILLPRWRELTSEFHSVKRTISAAGKVLFEVKRTNKGHGDRFWSIGAACQIERGGDDDAPTGTVRIFG